MVKEYKLEIQCFGRDEHETIERAVEMLNQGASFDRVIYLSDSPINAQQKNNFGDLNRL